MKIWVALSANGPGVGVLGVWTKGDQAIAACLPDSWDQVHVDESTMVWAKPGTQQRLILQACELQGCEQQECQDAIPDRDQSDPNLD